MTEGGRKRYTIIYRASEHNRRFSADFKGMNNDIVSHSGLESSGFTNRFLAGDEIMTLRAIRKDK